MNKPIIIICLFFIVLSLFVYWVDSGLICTDDGCESFYYEKN